MILMIRVLELFGGIGACSKALERLNIQYEIADYVEIDKFAVKSFNQMHNTNYEPQDITKWDKQMDVDLIMHGSPCQDFSLAGKQAGGDKDSGTRSSLMYETIRIVNKLKPKYVIWENVKNILSRKHIHNFNTYIDTMNELGYNNYYQVMNAKNYGIPQNRERVFTVSIRKDIDKGSFVFPAKIELQTKLKDLLETDAEEKYYLSDKMKSYVLDSKDLQKGTKWEGRADNDTLNSDVAHTLSVRGAGGSQRAGVSNFIVDGIDREIKVKELKQELCDYLLEYNLIEENDVIRHSYSSSRMKNFYKQNSRNNDIAPTLDTRCDCLGVAVINGNKKGYDIAKDGDSVNLAYPNSTTRRGRVGHQVSQTLQCNGNMGVVNKLRIRKLTPKECWRLMGFDDADFEKAAKNISNAQLYKQAGNSIVVNVLEAILKKLLMEE